MDASLEQTVALLTRTPVALDAFLRGLPDVWTLRNEGKDTWDVLEVVEHLIHCEIADWMPRVKMILEFGDGQTFAPFDRLGGMLGERPRALPESLDEFARLRSANLAELQRLNLQPEDLDRLGRHPAFGVVTLSQLLATWAAHDLTHLHQISRVMAYQYRESVGPWSVYLGVMQCAGHSE